MKTERKIPIKLLSYIKQDLRMKLEMRKSVLESRMILETK